MSFIDDPVDEFGFDRAISICISAIAGGVERDEYLVNVPSALINLGDSFIELIPAEDQIKIASLLARQVWNTSPIPAKGYHRDPLPNPKRNDRCPCGSRLKYKQCCLKLPPLPFEKLSMWVYLLDFLSVNQLDDALASKQIPLDLYAEVGIAWLADGETTRVVRLLEPLFEQGRKIDSRLGHAMNVLCDAFDELGHRNKKVKFLERIAGGHTGVSGDAWQRLVTLLIDQNDFDGATDAFQQAMRCEPDDPNLASLEVLLMVQQGKDKDHISERIRFWKRKLRRWGMQDSSIMELLENAEDDPQGAFVTGIEHALDPAFMSLRQWISEVLQPRKLPVYGILMMDPPEEDELGGIQGHLIDVPEGVLEPPLEVQKVERQWLEVFPVGKPFSTQTLYHPEAWEQTDWLTFLQQHHQAADSLSILDDLVGILDGFPEIDWIGLADSVFQPIYDRARDILLKSIDAQGKEFTLPWPALENRPALRLLFQRAMQGGGPGAEIENFEQLVKINPGDNHGVRSLLINHYLRAHEDNKAIELANAYPQDIMVDIRFGEILATYRLGDQKEAESLLREAHDEHPLVARALWRKRIKQPALDPYGVTIGGEDEAWMYREEMRYEWASTPGALDWIRKMTK